MFGIGGGEIFVIVVVILLIFGPSKIPEVARLLGRFYRELTRVKRQVDDTIADLRQEIDLNLDEPQHTPPPPIRPPAGQRVPQSGAEPAPPGRQITLAVPEADDYLLPLEKKNAGLSEASRRIEQQYAKQSEPRDPSDYLGGDQ